MRPGDRLGPFEILRPLGRGAASDVYLARNTANGREVALKLVSRATTESDLLAAEEQGAALQLELAKRAPQVAAVYGAGVLEDFFFVEMEVVEGQDLRSALAASGGKLPLERALAIARDLLTTLDICHHFAGEILGREVRGIIHGDIKPENLRLQAGDRVRILDFGASTYLTATHKVARNAFGTYPYTPPERLESGGDVDEMSDLWAVGILLYKAVSGQEPYPGSTPEQLERQILTTSPRALPAETPERLGHILRKALAFDPTHRYATASAFLRDLEAFAAGGPLAADELPDLGATRRTFAGNPGAGGETRRTTAPLAGAAPVLDTGPVPVGGGAEPASAARAFWAGRWKRWAAILAALLLGSQAYVAREAGQVARELRTDETPDLDLLWPRYDAIAKYSLFGLGMGVARQQLAGASLKEADGLFARYRADTPCDAQRAQREAVRAADWRRVCAHLHRARLAASAEDRVRGSDLYCQAQLERLAALDAESPEEKSEHLHSAAALFNQAIENEVALPDAFIGLMSIYAYHDPDFSLLSRTLDDFKGRGFEGGLREVAIEADACRGEARRLWKVVAVKKGGRLECPPELASDQAAHLATAERLLARAVELYKTPLISSCSWVRNDRKLAEDLLDDVSACSQAHAAPTPEPSPFL